MPTTVNGIGTHYYGKTNVHTYMGTCESCGQHTELTDYETGLYFVVIFIPIIPLGRKQIVSECPLCTRHRVMPLHEWKRISEEAVSSGMNDLSANRDDPEAAMELIRTMTFFNRTQEATDLANASAVTHAHDIEMQLFLMGWFEHMNQMELSEECFQRAVKLDPNHPGVLRGKAFDALQVGDWQTAETNLMPLMPPSEHYDPTLVYILAKGYHDAQIFDKAHQFYSVIVENNPEFQEEADFRKTVRQCEEAMGRTQSIVRDDHLTEKPIFYVILVGIVIALIVGAFVFSKALFG